MNVCGSSDDAFLLQVKLQVYREYFRTIGLTFIMTVVFLSAFQQAASLAYNYWLRLWADQPTVNGTSNEPALKLGIFAALGITQGQNYQFCSQVTGTTIPLTYFSHFCLQ